MRHEQIMQAALRGLLAGRVSTEVMHGSEALELIAALPEVDTVTRRRDSP